MKIAARARGSPTIEPIRALGGRFTGGLKNPQFTPKERPMFVFPSFFRPSLSSTRTDMYQRSSYFGYDSGSKFFGPFEFLWKKPGCTHFAFRRTSGFRWIFQLWALNIVWQGMAGREIGFYTMDGDNLVVYPGLSKIGRSGHREAVRWSFDMPWSWSLHRTSILLKYDGLWRPAKGRCVERDMHPSGVWVRVPLWYPRGQFGAASAWTVPFVWKDPVTGEEDHVTCTARADRMTWRRKWLPWTDLFSKTHHSVWMDFSAEIGPEKGSWKGGVTGTGIEMLPGETVEQTVQRAQSEIKIRRR